MTLATFSGLYRRQLRPDNGHKWDGAGTKREGFYGVRCIYCNSTLTRKNGNRINSYQQCQTCNNIFSIPALKFRQSNLPRVCCPHCSTFNEIKLTRSWRCTGCNRSFYDEDRIRKATSKRHTGFYGVSCIYCNSKLTRKNGKRIRTSQRCQACANIFCVPVNQRQSNLPAVSCPQCNVSNKIKVVQNWICTECNKTFCDGDKNQ